MAIHRVPLHVASASCPIAHIRVVALDVEYIHFRCNDQLVILPGEVCVVDVRCDVLVHSYCNPGRAEAASRYWAGGVKPDKWQRAPRIPAVAAMVAAAIQDQLLVGHGLKKDLHSLSLTHPPHLTRDTMTYEVFQSRGHARKLKALTLDLLGKSIQMGRHRAREDATAALQLYLAHIEKVEPDAEVLMRYHLSQLGTGLNP